MTAVSRANEKSLDERRKGFNQLVADEWEYEMREAPEFATVVCDYRYNDRWSNLSLAHVSEQTKDLESWLSRFEEVDTIGFPEQEKLSQLLMVQGLKLRIEGDRLKTFEMPIDQFFGVHLVIAQMVSFSPFDTTRQYEDYLARLGKVPALIDQIIEVLRQGEKDKLMPPRFLLEKTVAQCKSIADPAGDTNPFAQPLSHFPDAIPAADRARLKAAIVGAIDHHVRPAYRKLGEFLATDYAPKGRTDFGGVQARACRSAQTVSSPRRQVSLLTLEHSLGRCHLNYSVNQVFGIVTVQTSERIRTEDDLETGNPARALDDFVGEGQQLLHRLEVLRRLGKKGRTGFHSPASL